jgi:hypothetical protein
MPLRIHAPGGVLLLSLFLCASHAQEADSPAGIEKHKYSA